MACLSRVALASLLISACAGGENDEGGSGMSFGGSNPNSASQSAPMTDASMTSMTDAVSDSGEDSEAMTTRPTDPTRPTTSGALDDTGVDSFPETSTTDDSSTTNDSTTTGPVVLCGNAVIDAPEECDGANLNGQTCASQGFTGGTLTCTPACIFDKSMCTSPSCGDATVDPGEECDCGQQGANCTGAQLGNATCGSLQSPKGTPYAGGSLTCNSPASCSFNKAACTYCGDGIRNNAEQCDAADLGGQTCNGLGFNGGGALNCNGDCSFNTGACMNIVCGNGQCQQGEDSCSCPQDCPDDPNSCSPCQCGLYFVPCACDPACVQFGDCCANGPC